MEKRQAELMDLHEDILKEIIMCVARSSDGARDFANAMSVCKAFRRFVEDGDVLRAVAFDDMSLKGRWELFQRVSGLVCRCAQAGQEQAQCTLAKIIIVSTSWLLTAITEAEDEDDPSSFSDKAKDGNLIKENAQAFYFLENFLPHKAPHNCIGYHFDFLKIFLCRVRLGEFPEIDLHLYNYLSYFLMYSLCRYTYNDEFLIAQQFVRKFLFFLGTLCYCVELCERFFVCVRDFRLGASEVWQSLGLKKEQEDRTDLGADEGEEVYSVHFCDIYVNTLKAKLDVILQHLRVLKVTIGKLDKVSDDFSAKGDDSFVALSLTSAEVTFIVNEIQHVKNHAACLQEMQTDAVSKFHGFFSRLPKVKA